MAGSNIKKNKDKITVISLFSKAIIFEWLCCLITKNNGFIVSHQNDNHHNQTNEFNIFASKVNK